MRLQCSLLLAVQVLSVLALPAPDGIRGASRSRTTSAAQATATAGTGTGEGEGEGAENEIEQAGQFDTAIELGGGNIKTDTQFPPGVSHPSHRPLFPINFLVLSTNNLTHQTNGVFEVEFQNAEGRVLTVTENKNPAAAPAGFMALEPVSYKVELEGGAASAQGLTLQKIDYIRNANSELLFYVP